MSETLPKQDVIDIRRCIHGERVAEEHICDYCDSQIEVNQAVQYEIIRTTEFPNLVKQVNPSQGWIPDALRCDICIIDQLHPQSQGYDEVLVMVDLNKSNGFLSIDASSLTVVDFSPRDEGYETPAVDPRLMMHFLDLGLPRWIRIKELLRYDEGVSDVVDLIRDAVEQLSDVPPGFVR